MQKFLRFLMLAVLLLPFALQAQVSLPISMDFEDATAFSQWTLANCESTTTRSTSGAHEGTYGFGFHWTYNPPQYLISPEFDAATGSEMISFWYKNTSSTYTEVFEVGFSSTTNDTTAFTWLSAVTVPNIPWTEYTAMVPAGTKYVAIKSSGYDQYYLYIDDIYIGTDPTCFKVTGLSINAALTTSSSLTLTWSDTLNGDNATYNIYDMSTNEIIEAGVSGTTYTIDGLNANTAYTYGIETDCGGGDIAAGLVIVSGRTACDLQSLPWTCGFEANEIVSTTQATALPWCTSRYSAPSTVSYPNYPYSYSSNYHTGSRCLYFYGATSSSYPDTMAIILPEIDVNTYPMDGNRLTFWARSGSTSYDKVVYVGTLTDLSDMSTYTLVDSVTVTGTTYTLYSIPLTSANTTDPYVCITVLKGNGNLYIDDMTLEELPSCLEVSNVTIVDSLTTVNSITISWADTQNPDGTTYTIYNMADTTDVEATITDNVALIENLNPNTVYTFGVQANCAAGDAAYMTVSGRTACATETMPWSENFNDWTSKSPCWSFLSGDYNGGNGTPTESTSAWSLSSSYGSYITIDGKALAMNLYSTLKYWAVTPPINITSDEAMLSVDVAVSAWSSATPNYDNNDSLVFALTTNNGASYTTLRVLDNTELNALENTYTTLYIPVNGYNDQDVRFVIYGGSTSGTSPYDNRIVFDNVTVGEPLACLPVSRLIATPVSFGATLTWEGNADSYTIYVADSTTEWSEWTNVTFDNDTTAILSGLDANTAYTFGVQANCGSEESTIIPVNFTTLVSCPAPTDLVVSLTPGDGTVASLSWNGNGTEAWEICLNGDITNLIPVADNSYDFTDLTPEQAYNVKVRANCDGDDNSTWSNTVNFTPTDAYTLTVNDGTTTNGYVPIYGYWCDNFTKSQFIIPASNLTAMQFGIINKLTFYASDANVDWGDAEFDVYVTETSETTLSALADYTTMTQVYAGSLSIIGNKMEVTFSNSYLYMGGNLMIGFLQTVEGDYESCSWYGVTAAGASMGGYNSSITQQNFLPKTTIAFIPGEEPTCMPVTSLSVSNITGNGATLTWNSEVGSYTIYDLADTTIVGTASDETYEFDDLEPMTQYKYGVVANCGSDESMMISVTFNTACSSVELPYTETFETTSNTRDCWNLVATGNIGGTYGMGFVTVNNSEVLRFSSYSYATDYNQYGYSPLMEVSSDATVLMVNVDYATYNSSNILNFGYVTDTDTIWDPTEYTTTGSNDWQTFTATIPATATQLAIHYYGNYSWYAWIDNVSVIEITDDYCWPVTNLTVDSTTSNSVFLSWIDTLNSGTYTIYNGSDVVATGIPTTEYEVTGLTPATTYTFGVVANCSADNESAIRTVAANTDCGIINVFPYTQDFNATPLCWSAIDADGDGYNWYLYSGTIQSESYSNDASSALTPDNWLITPQFAIPSTGSYEVTWTATAQDQSWPAEHYGVYVSTTTADSTANFTMLQEWTLSTGIFNPVIDLSAYAGQNIYIALRHFNCTDMFRLSIDDFIVREQAGANQVTINVGQNNPAYGTVTGGGIYNIGDSVTVSATAATGYDFSKWVDEDNNLISNDNPYTFIAATDLTLKAIFLNAAGTTYTITVEVNDSLMGTATGGGVYTAGEQITLSATANSGYHFVNWTQSSSFGFNEVGTDPELIITVTGDKTFIANFEADSGTVTQYTVTLNTDNPTMGSVSPAGASTVNGGTTFTATATALDGYHFVAWMNGTTQVSTNSQYEFIVTGDITLTATFAANDPQVTYYNVTVNSANPNMGSVTSSHSGQVAENTVVTVTATSADGYHFVAWMNGTTQVSTNTTYEFTVTGDITLTATFEANDPQVTYYNVTVSSANTDMGNVSSTHSGQVAENTEVTVTATPAEGYRFINWVNAEGTVVSTDNPYTFTVTGDITLVATFELIDGINDVDASNITIYAYNNIITVRGAEGNNISVFDMNGRCVNQLANANETETMTMSTAGIYLVKISNGTVKKVVIVK